MENNALQSFSFKSIKTFLNSFTFDEVLKGIWGGFFYSRSHLFHSYIMIPMGIIILLSILYGLNLLLTNVWQIKFPCSVLGMLINLVWLCTLNLLSNLGSQNPDSKGIKYKISNASSWILNKYLNLVKPSMNFTLKWINVFFIPSFIILPLSDTITFVECMKIVGVFVVGFILLFCIDIYFILALKHILHFFGLFKLDNDLYQKNDPEQDAVELETISNRSDEVFTSMRDDITTIDILSLKSFKTGNENNRNLDLQSAPRITPISIEGSSHMNEHNHINIPQMPEPVHPKQFSNPIYTPHASMKHNETEIEESVSESDASIDVTNASSSKDDDIADNLTSNARVITLFINKYIDWILYFTLFTISLPLYYVSSIHSFLLYHLSITIIAYYLALLIPQKWPSTKKFAHPILILTGEILFMLFIGSLIYHRGKPEGFMNDLKYYKTGKTYLYLFNNKIWANSAKVTSTIPSDFTGTPKWPGCGDVLSSLMDVSIVSLSLPMFSFRRDFIRNFWILVPPILASIMLTFFLYPIVCYNIGISPERSIGFIGRSVTLALGTPLINALEGSVSLMAVCTIMSGICGVLIGDTVFNILRIAKNDYVTRGVSLGINCGAIATAHLLNTDPRAASMSSLSFSLFGTIMVIFASISSIRDLIRSWVGL